MKRKAIQRLLQSDEPADQLLQLLPEAETARQVLAATLAVSRERGITDPDKFYFQVCSSTAAQLQEFLQGTSAAKLSRDKIARAQAILNQALTSKAGRPKESNLSRAEQLAAAQARRREKLGHVEGRKQLNDWISAEAAAYLAEIKEIHGCQNRAEALELVLQAAIKGKALKVKSK